MKVGFEWFVCLFCVVLYEIFGVVSFCLNYRLGLEEIEKYLIDLV